MAWFLVIWLLGGVPESPVLISTAGKDACEAWRLAITEDGGFPLGGVTFPIDRMKCIYGAIPIDEPFYEPRRS